MVEKIKNITEKTSLSLSLLLALAALAVGVVTWASSVEARLSKNTFINQDLEQHRVRDDELMQKQVDFLRSVDARLSRIEGKLGVK